MKELKEESSSLTLWEKEIKLSSQQPMKQNVHCGFRRFTEPLASHINQLLLQLSQLKATIHSSPKFKEASSFSRNLRSLLTMLSYGNGNICRHCRFETWFDAVFKFVVLSLNFHYSFELSIRRIKLTDDKEHVLQKSEHQKLLELRAWDDNVQKPFCSEPYLTNLQVWHCNFNRASRVQTYLKMASKRL